MWLFLQKAAGFGEPGGLGSRIVETVALLISSERPVFIREEVIVAIGVVFTQAHIPKVA